MNLIENCQDLMIMYSHVLVTFMGPRRKLGLGNVGLKKIHLPQSDGPRDASGSNITMAAQEKPKFSSNFYWLVMVGLEELHL